MIPLSPMLPTLVDEPFDSPAYLFEPKWDGIRCLCLFEGETVRLYSRRGRDITAQFPELEGLGRAVAAKDAVLDGEICVFDGAAPSFHLVHRRMTLQASPAVRRAAAESPAVYVVFDLLRLDGEEQLAFPLQHRRKRLDSAWCGSDYGVLSPQVPQQGRQLFAESLARGLEGIVAKRADSPYIPGRRTRHWLKVRRRLETDCIIVGYRPSGSRAVAALALGAYLPAASGPAERRLPQLRYVGTVAPALPPSAAHDLLSRLFPLRTGEPSFTVPADGSNRPALPPGMQWVLPRLVCRIGYLELTPGGRLRHGTFLGLRDDKDPSACVLPEG
ncbi:MAG: ATP-dependent DNA ligase [Firmicutes bacterium]|nr:ATP-dependent DNA ligase [Bacillota bacterium]